jgi:hypothetical protein
MKRKIFLVLLVTAAPAAFAASAPGVPPGASLRPEMCLGWRLSESEASICLGEMRIAATDAEREAIARRFAPDYRLPAGAPDDGFGRPPANPAFTQSNARGTRS